MITSFSFLFLLLSSIETRSLNHHQIDIKENDSIKFNKGIHSNRKAMKNYNIFSPRMDYDEWTPLGRGDPLKNDPTYDYVPPVLERVHYWMEPSQRTPDPPLPNSGVMVMVSRTEFPHGTRFSTPSYQIKQSKEAESRFDASSFLNPFFKLINMTQMGANFNSNNHPKHPLGSNVQRPHLSHDKQQKTQPPQVLQRPPHTMLMPPPPPHSLPHPPATPQTFPSFTSPATTMIQNNNRNEWTTDSPPPMSSSSFASENVTTTVNPTALANTENVFKPVAISMPGPVGEAEAETQLEVKYKIAEDGSSVLPHLKREPSLTGENEENTIKRPSETMLPPKEINYKKNQFAKIFSPWNEGSVLTSTPLQATTDPIVTTTKINALTTDPVFKHYKQPSELVRGPFYLIIQGHSKVKTYGASKNPINQALTSNEIKREDDKNQSRQFQKKSLELIERDYAGKKSVKSFRRSGRHFDDEEDLISNVKDDSNRSEMTFGDSKTEGSGEKIYFERGHGEKRSPHENVSIKAKRPVVEESSSDNLNLESLIALSDDYEPEDVANFFLKQEESQGSGFGDLAFSIFRETDPENLKKIKSSIY